MTKWVSTKSQVQLRTRGETFSLPLLVNHDNKFEATKMSPSLHANTSRVEGALRTKLTEHVELDARPIPQA
jgi:hypothetical protein